MKKHIRGLIWINGILILLVLFLFYAYGTQIQKNLEVSARRNIAEATFQATQLQLKSYEQWQEDVSFAAKYLTDHGNSSMEEQLRFMKTLSEEKNFDYYICEETQGKITGYFYKDGLREMDLTRESGIKELFQSGGEKGVTSDFFVNGTERRVVAFYHRNPQKKNQIVIALAPYEQLSTYNITAAGEDSYSCILDPGGNILMSSTAAGTLSYRNFFSYWKDQIGDKEAVETLQTHMTLMEKGYEALDQNNGEEMLLSFHRFDNNSQWRYYVTVVHMNQILNREKTNVLAILCLVCLLLIFSVEIFIIFSQNKKLRKAVEVATEASQAKGDFLSHMSHEIRTPLTTIMGLAEIAEQNMENLEEVRDCIEKSKIASNHLLSLINDILDMSKIESNKMTLHPENMEVYALMQNIANVYGPAGEKKGVAFLLEGQGVKGMGIVGDALRIRQILMNFVSNAIKFTEAGGKIIFAAKVLEETEKEVTLLFSVHDTGVGIQKEQLDTIFDPFEQGEAARRTVQAGTGLGLSIAGQLAKLMGGRVGVESIYGQGSTFTFQATFLRGEVLEQGTLLLPSNTPPNLAGKHILVVEDHRINAQIVKKLLSATNGEVTLAFDGIQGVEKVQESPEGYFDIIFMDIQMPRMNGYEATEAIRNSGREDAKKVVIIAMTANAYQEDVENALQAGMNGHLAKPFQPKDLYGILSEYFPEKPK